jgi:hypothetical protein
MIRGQVPHRPQEHVRSKPALPAPGYQRSRAALGDSTRTTGIAAALEHSAASRPYATDTLPGLIVRVLYAPRYDDYPGLRLFYSVDDMAIRLLRIEHYDELDP